MVEIEPIKPEDINGNKFELTFNTTNEETLSALTALANAQKIKELQENRDKEQAYMELIHQNAAGSNIYMPYHPLKQKQIWHDKKFDEHNRPRKARYFVGKTENDYLSVIEAKRYRYEHERK